MQKRHLFSALGLFLVAGSALAHPGHGTATFSSGFAHPFGGVDHLLAMLAVGLYAASQSGRQRWMLPAAFVSMMVAGAALGAAVPGLPMVEAGISASVLVLGLLIAFAARMPLVAAVPMVGAFALCHGYAHAAEAGAGSLVQFAVGFVAATALLHGLGYAVARWMPESAPARAAKRVLGGAIALTGVALLGS